MLAICGFPATLRGRLTKPKVGLRVLDFAPDGKALCCDDALMGINFGTLAERMDVKNLEKRGVQLVRTSCRWRAIAAGVAITVVPSVAVADACYDHYLAIKHYEAVESHINRMGDQAATQEGADRALQLLNDAELRIELARGAIRHSLQNDSGAAITIDALSELDFQASRGMQASWQWVRESDEPPPRTLQANILSIMLAIDEANDVVFSALCQEETQ